MIQRFVFAALLLAMAPRPALADPVKLPDPFIGVRGEDGSIDSRIPGFHELGGEDCPAIEGVQVFCQTFDIFQHVKKGVVQNITFAFTELDGFGLENEFLSPDPSQYNQFSGNFVREEDGFSVTLFFQTPIRFLSTSRYGRPGFPCSNYDKGEQNCTLQVYLYPGPNDEVRGPYATSLRAINGVTIDTTPIPAPVPEPGTLLLMGAGIASLAARRMRRRSS